MARQIIFYEHHFIDFYKELDLKVKEKFQYTLELIKQVDNIPEKFFGPIIVYVGLKFESNFNPTYTEYFAVSTKEN